MLSIYIKKPHVVKRMEESYFGDKFNSYVTHLHKYGYSQDTIKLYCQAIEHFGKWLQAKSISRKNIDKNLVKTFIKKHLPRCKCAMPKTKEVRTIRAAINQLFKIIYIKPTLNSNDRQFKILNSFEEYLHDVCGSAKNTCIYRRRYISYFLKQNRIHRLSDCKEISPKNIMKFIKTFSFRYKTGSMGVVSGSLRSFFRYLSFCGYNAKRLIAAVPTVPNYKLSNIPKFICDSDIRRLLLVFNRRDPSSKRDYAMMRCLIDLGLRCCEVSNLKIKDINWHTGNIKIMRVKSNQEKLLPLPRKLGKAIADYLKHGRPKSNSEFIFVYHRAPFGEGVQVGTVRNAVRRAFEKAGFNPIPSTHILRHSFATNLLISGTSLKGIADILGHKTIDTTMIYTKVDLPNLFSVAMPWFGRTS